MHEVTHVSPVFLRLLRVTLPQDTSCLHTSENRLFEDVFLSSQLRSHVVLFLQDPSNKVWLVSHALKVMQPDTLLIELLLKKFRNQSVKYFPLH